ncbi:phenylalanine-4-hydroxylase-like isoform X1 [Mytilus edulis]|uniref:phenylalanine-4-hydroxylase-like isoform X1 n=1 Tax=Mytilus edulis TaxID=6550 RepID=UPI0039EF60B1
MYSPTPRVPSDPQTAKRRLAFQKSYSQEHGGSWRRKSLIEDAKFETVTNLEFEKRERTLSNRNSISEEEEEVFVQNGECISPIETEPPHAVLLIISIKDGISSLSRILRIFEASKVIIDHIESRKSKKSGAQFEILIKCVGSRDKITSHVNSLRMVTSIADVAIVSDQEVENKVIWFPRHISELDNCTHLVTKFEPELDSDHPGYTDKKYRERRKMIADIAFDYRHGQVIPRVEYTQEENDTWGHVYKHLQDLFPTHACKEHIENFKILEQDCGYSEDKIPQLEDVSNFLKRRTGFQLRPVSGLLSARDFLASLAYRVFQCTQYVRHGSKPDHSPEPDCIHELLGHVPMLANPKFAQFSQEIGLTSLGASDADIEKFATLYWFTVEFGLCKEQGSLRAYGAGTLSSYGELRHALSDAPKKYPFDPEKTSVQVYTDEDIQPIYFVVESFDDMMQKMKRYAATIKRQFEVRYDPYTQTIQELGNEVSMQYLHLSLQNEVESLQRAVKELKV